MARAPALWTVLALFLAHTAEASPDSLPSGFIRGMTFAHVHSRAYGYGSDRAKRELMHLRADGVDWIALSTFAYQSAVDEPSLYFGARDPTMLDDDLLAVTDHAHQLGMKVMLKPHIWSRQFWDGGKWQGDIAMKSDADDAKWWEAYRQFVLKQAELAERAHMDGLCIGLEYVKMTDSKHTPKWKSLIAAVRTVYRGPLTYGAHHERELEQIEFWGELDAIGVHAYFPFSAELEQASSEVIASAWKPLLDRMRVVAERHRKPIVFTEIGYPAHKGALERPWHSDRSLPPDEGVQARAYEGALRALSEAPFVRGIFVWKWFSGGADNPEEHDPYDPSGKAAEQVLARWYRSRGR
jgi:hypothetical protein